MFSVVWINCNMIIQPHTFLFNYYNCPELALNLCDTSHQMVAILLGSWGSHTHTRAPMLSISLLISVTLMNPVKDYMVDMVNIPSVAGILPTWQLTGDREANTKSLETLCRLWSAAKNITSILLLAKTKTQQHLKCWMSISCVYNLPISILPKPGPSLAQAWQDGISQRGHLTKQATHQSWQVLYTKIIMNAQEKCFSILAFPPGLSKLTWK